MKRFQFLVFIAIFIFPSTVVFSQDAPTFEVIKLADHIYKLTTDGGGYDVKVIVSIGDDGILLVDAGKEETGEDLKAQIQDLWGGLPKIIISTHSHLEHTAGNIAFSGEPTIIGHKKLRTTLQGGSYIFDEIPEEVLPDLTFADSLSLHFNGEEIKLIAFPGCHDNSDIIVWFTESKIVCVGALSNGSHFPSVDGATGDVLKYPEIVANLIDALPDNVTIIPGHGADGTMEDFRVFHDMLVKTTEIVRTEVAKGKDLAILQEENVLKDWASFEGSYVDRNQWIEYLVEGFEGGEDKKDIYEPMYYALRDKGLDGAIEYYHELKRTKSDEFLFDEGILMYIGYKLYRNDRTDEAVRFFQLCNSEYPGGSQAWLCYHFMGKIYHSRENTELALENLTKSLELNPDNTTAAELIEEIKGK
jgi:glyoxylase-like metal-dependent hydrolase (beta-lactamase superfamily II)